MARRSGSADLPLHGGQVPKWLADRMTRLGAVMTQAVVHHYGRDELLRRLANPFWFQAFGAEKHKGTLYSFATILPCGGPAFIGLARRRIAERLTRIFPAREVDHVILLPRINGSRVRRESPARRTGAFQTSRCECAR